MTIYDERNKPAYEFAPPNPSYSNNPYILSWWSDEHDKLIRELIDDWQWDWPWHVTDAIKQITPSQILDDWRARDPICEEYAWYNIITHFALSWAHVHGLTAKIRSPLWKVCPLCQLKFVESSLPSSLVSRLSINGLDYCSPCLRDIVFPYTGNPSSSKEEIREYLIKLSDALKQIPHQGFGEGMKDLRYLDKQERLMILTILKEKPSVGRVKQLFGSWLEALIDSGILDDGTRKTSRGTQCLAKDGHICFSLAEKTIDDYLCNHNILHSKEPLYPGSNMRADFLVKSAFIEYFGLRGDPEYDRKTIIKKKLCCEHGLFLLELYPEDLVSIGKLEKKIFTLMANHLESSKLYTHKLDKRAYCPDSSRR